MSRGSSCFVSHLSSFSQRQHFPRFIITPRLLPALVNRFLIWNDNACPRPFEERIPCHHCLFLSFIKCCLYVNAFCKRITSSEISPGQNLTLACYFILFNNSPVRRGGETRLWRSGYCWQVSLFMENCWSASAVGSSDLSPFDKEVVIVFESIYP